MTTLTKSQTEQLRESCAAYLCDLASRSIGPCGRPAALSTGKQHAASVITSISGRLMEGHLWRDPLTRLLVQTTAQAQHAQHGDGGLLCLLLACKMLLLCGPLACTPLRRQEVLAALTLAAKWCSELLSPLPLQAGNVNQSMLPAAVSAGNKAGGSSGLVLPLAATPSVLTALVRTALSAKPGICMSERELCRVSGLLVQAVMDARPTAGRTDLQYPTAPLAVRILPLPLPGLATDSSMLFPGAMIEPLDSSTIVSTNTTAGHVSTNSTLPVRASGHGNMPCSGRPGTPPLHNACLVLFSVALDTAAEEQGQGMTAGLVLQSDVSQPDVLQAHVIQSDLPEPSLECAAAACFDPRAVKLSTLAGVVQQLSAAGVQVVVCQQTIHPAIAHALRMHCILPLPRVGRAGVAAVASATGATPIASIEDVLPGHTPAGQVQPGEGKPARVSSSSSARHEEGTPYLQGASARADVQLVQLGQKTFIQITRPTSTLQLQVVLASTPQPQSLVVGCPLDAAGDELSAALHAAMRMVVTAMRQPQGTHLGVAVAGGGACEVMLARSVRGKVRRRRKACLLTALQMDVLHGVAASLEAVPQLLCPSLDPSAWMRACEAAWPMGPGHKGHALLCKAGLLGMPSYEQVPMQMLAERCTASPLHHSSTHKHGMQPQPPSSLQPKPKSQPQQQPSMQPQPQPQLQSQSEAPLQPVHEERLLLDSRAAKQSAIVTALEAVCVVLRVDTCCSLKA